MSEQEMRLLTAGDRLWICRSKWEVLQLVERGLVIAQRIDGKMEHKSLLEWNECKEAVKYE